MEKAKTICLGVNIKETAMKVIIMSCLNNHKDEPKGPTIRLLFI
ncbi:hypothetical protein [Clostridium pasteurianum]|uniref:Uncharacterized protein n=1 Tax=Clostridium pasteurianum BC1 TaxID=86416 RepID=R4K7C8_CLOPA|nr:hypothetical protein [Clostridium pasteurianum]AGK99077.1 hypothetical protein Clopa_4361 [Clostridium pasteurianum BC1]